MIRLLLQNPLTGGDLAPRDALREGAPRADSGDAAVVTSGKVRLLCIAAEWIINGDEAVEELDVEIIGLDVEELDGVLGIVFIISKCSKVVVPSCPP